MANPKKVLYFAENALSAIQGGGIVAYAVLKGLPAENLLGFYEYRNITPVSEYADRFTYLGNWRTPKLFDVLNRATGQRTTAFLHRRFTEQFIQKDLAFVDEQVERRGFEPEVVYFAGLSYRYLRLAVLAAERYDVPMVILHMDDWMTVEREHRRALGRLVGAENSRTADAGCGAALVSTSNSPRLAAKLTEITGHRHVAANNCCSDLMDYARQPQRTKPNRIPIITYAGAMNRHLQGETLKVLSSAVSELNAEGTRVQLHIYTPWEFAPDANAIAVPHAVFYKGQVGREQLADIYRRADFLVTPVTYRESNISLFRHSLSTKLSEYLCVGKPVISMGHRDWHLHEVRSGPRLRIFGPDGRELLTRAYQGAAAPHSCCRLRVARAYWQKQSGALGTGPRRHVDGASVAASRGADDGCARTVVRASERRGALWLGNPVDGGWVPLAKLKAIARRLVDVFEHDAVDLIGNGIGAHPDLDPLVTYCRDIGLDPLVALEPRTPGGHQPDCEPAGTGWSLADAQRRPDSPLVEPPTVFAQALALRGTAQAAATAVQRVINQLTVRVSESSSDRPVVWFYGSAAVGLEIINAIRTHRWLSSAVEIGGFLSSPGQCQGNVLYGHPWRSADGLLSARADFIVVASETSRLSIQEELSRLGLLDRMIAAFGMAAAAAVYERDPAGPGQAFVAGSRACDYATRELVARTSGQSQNAPTATDSRESVIQAAA